MTYTPTTRKPYRYSPSYARRNRWHMIQAASAIARDIKRAYAGAVTHTAIRY